MSQGDIKGSACHVPVVKKPVPKDCWPACNQSDSSGSIFESGTKAEHEEGLLGSTAYLWKRVPAMAGRRLSTQGSQRLSVLYLRRQRLSICD